jgi:hypothetical protein
MYMTEEAKSSANCIEFVSLKKCGQW